MADELVDVVNERDEVIGQEMKSKCHKEGILHRISAIFLFNSHGKIWLQTRAKGKVGAGRLDFSASGHLGAGDSYDEGAYREMQEELGIKVKLKLIGKELHDNYLFEGHNVRHLTSLYTGRYDGSFNLQEEELEKVEAFSIKEIKEMMKNNPDKIMFGLKIGLNYLFKQNDLQQ